VRPNPPVQIGEVISDHILITFQNHWCLGAQPHTLQTQGKARRQRHGDSEMESANFPWHSTLIAGKLIDIQCTTVHNTFIHRLSPPSAKRRSR
ncbi:MAG TPA: hypothetical protein PLB25_19010, partial [Rhodoferax sp.]|nr:hypothetical protein [Rhodoferax sp.]